MRFKSSGDEIDTKYNRLKKINIKEFLNAGNEQVADPDLKMLIFLGMLHYKALHSRVKRLIVTRRMLQINFLYFSTYRRGEYTLYFP